jgi:hypothetical protein
MSNSKLSYDDCELLLLTKSVNEIKKVVGKEKVQSSDITKIIDIVEKFIRKTKCICYGGTAINDILPQKDQFYNREYEIPDYDFFSDRAVELAVELADRYRKAGYRDIVAQSGIHYGTYKVFVNFIPVADITYIPTDLYKRLLRDSIVKDGIHYCPPDYLRMSMYLELSHPRGDISRWEKVYSRLKLLNKHYPIDGVKCTFKKVDNVIWEHISRHSKVKLNRIIHQFCESQEAVFFGTFAYNYYTKNFDKEGYTNGQKHLPDFDVFLIDPVKCAKELKDQIVKLGEYKEVEIFVQGQYLDLIGERASIYVDGHKIITMYEPLACHSYNEIRHMSSKVRIATVDTILSMYFMFQYTNEDPTIIHRLVCMCYYLFNIQNTYACRTTTVLKRFSLPCYGTQHTLESLRSIKLAKYIELYKYKNKPANPKYDEYQRWFLKYIPMKEESESLKRTSKTKSMSKTPSGSKKSKSPSQKSFSGLVI